MKKRNGILVVDDNVESLRLIIDNLVSEGFTVRPVTSGEQALQAVQAEPPELILLDVRMPGIDGFEVCRQLQSQESTRSIPILFLSGLSDGNERANGLKLGAKDFITKPVLQEELLARVRTHLELSRLQRNLEEKVQERTQELHEKNDELLATEEMLRAQIEDYESSQKLLTKSQSVLAEAQSITHIGSWELNLLNSKLVWSEEIYRIFEIEPAKFSATYNAFLNVIHPDDRDAVNTAYTSSLESKKPYDIEHRLLMADGREKIVHERCVTFFDVEGHPIRSIGTVQDVTERKRREEEMAKLEAQFHQAQKMETVGLLAGGVAHDFNNMLTVILGHAQLGLMHLDSTHPVCADLTQISKTAQRSAELTRQLLAFARKQTITPIVLDLNETVAGMFKMLKRLIGEGIQLNWHPSPDLWPVNIDPSQIDQLLANLCVNARDAIADTGKIAIETGNSSLDEEYCSQSLGFAVGEYVRLTVSDDGCGMDKMTQAQIFEPFFTTKGLGKGTGLGLATVYGIVKQNSGFIDVYSEPGIGTTFTIYFPRYPGEAEVRTEGTTKPDSRGWETILLVEDEESILHITSLILRKQGYTVLVANRPSEAIRLASEQAGVIHLLMTDVVMPEMNGRDLAKKLLLTTPQLKCLFMSGYTANVTAHHDVLDKDVQFIQKPFSFSALTAKVRGVLDSKTVSRPDQALRI